MRHRGGSVVLVVMSVALVGLAATLSPVPAVAGARASLAAVGERVAVPTGAVRLGQLAAATSLRLRIVLQPRQAAALASFVGEVSTPGSPSYRQYLDKGQFAGRFGPTTATLAAVRADLAALGLSPGAVSSDRLVIAVDATAIAAERAFHVTLFRYRLPGGRTVFANSTPPLLGAAVARDILAVLGLDDIALTGAAPGGGGTAGGGGGRLQASPAKPRQPHSSGPRACAAADDGTATAGTLAGAYGLTALYAKGDLGSGQTVALFESESVSAANVATYQKCYGTHTTVKTIPVDGGVALDEGTLEATSDVEDVIGLAPHVTILVYETQNLFEPNWLDEWTRIVDDDSAQVVSTSWLDCEPQPGSSYLDSENLLFEQAAAQGQTVVAAAGDYGAESCDQFFMGTGLSVDDPASQPYVTGVGGTQWPGSSRSGETTWNATQGAGGGGLSSVWPMPSWQRGPGVLNTYSSGKPCHAKSGDCREVPDVSALAGAPFYGFYCTAADCSNIGGWGFFWGTSFAAPLWAATISLANESCGAPAAGFLNPALYALAASAHPPFHDITTGDNAFKGKHGKDYPATKGYDLATGLGTPIAGASSGSTLAAELCALDSPTSIELRSGTAKVVSSNKTALTLSLGVSEVFTGTSPSLSLSVTLSSSSAGATETHTWGFPLPAADLSERGGDATVASARALGGFGSVTLKFRKKSPSALACTRGSGTTDGGTLTGSVSFNTLGGAHGWGEVSLPHLSVSVAKGLTIDHGCVAPAPPPPACSTGLAWSLSAPPAGWSGLSTGASSSALTIETATKLASPKGAVRKDGLSISAAALTTTSSGGHLVLHVAGTPGSPITGAGSITGGASTTTDTNCLTGGVAHKEMAVGYSGTWAKGSPALTARFTAPASIVVAASGVARFVIESVH